KQAQHRDITVPPPPRSRLLQSASSSPSRHGPRIRDAAGSVPPTQTVPGDCWRFCERTIGSCAAMLTFQQLILRLQDYWDQQGCALLQPYDMEVGAGTSHTATFLRALGPEPWR